MVVDERAQLVEEADSFIISLLSGLLTGAAIVREIGAFEAKNKLGTLLDWVESGEEILITRRGKAVARLIPASPGFDRTKARLAADSIRARSAKASLGGLKIKDLVNEGRP